MESSEDARTVVTVDEYRDPVLGVKGYVAFSGRSSPLAVGGCRVQLGLTSEKLVQLAQVMQLKEQLLGLRIDGAKAGIDYPPDGPRKDELLTGFIGFLRPHLLGRFSMGPDAGTTWEMLERCAQQQDIASIKIAVARAQGIDNDNFLRRIKVLRARPFGLTVAEHRAGHGLAAAVEAAAAVLDLGFNAQLAIQGFGTLGRGAALTLARRGYRVVAVADEHACVVDEYGLDVSQMLGVPWGTPVTDAGQGKRRDSQAIYETPAEILVLAASEDVLSLEQVGALGASSIVVGANLGLSSEAEQLARELGILVVPDFVGGAGGSASMEALFGPQCCPTPREVLLNAHHRMRQVASAVLRTALAKDVSPRSAAMEMCMKPAAGEGPPYGEHTSRPTDGRPPGTSFASASLTDFEAQE